MIRRRFVLSFDGLRLMNYTPDFHILGIYIIGEHSPGLLVFDLRVVLVAFSTSSVVEVMPTLGHLKNNKLLDSPQYTYSYACGESALPTEISQFSRCASITILLD